MRDTDSCSASRCIPNRGEWAAASGLYRLLARIWLSEVDRELLLALTGSQLKDVFQAAGGQLPAGAHERPIEPIIDQLASEYCRLFIGPRGHLPPYQSFWEAGEFQAEPAVAMIRFSKQVGYPTPDSGHQVMPDHLGRQLDLMGFLLQTIDGQAAASTTSASSVPLFRLTSQYFQNHLAWSGPLLLAVKQQTTCKFYQSICSLTNRFLKSEARIWLDECSAT